jgi:Spy/CpxP family protein refolding chaperone
MIRHSVGRAAAAVLLLALAAPVSAQSFAWWKDEPFQKEVGLTADQCTRIDNVFQTTIPKLRQGKGELDRLQAELSQLIETNADEGAVVKQIDRVEAQRAMLNKMRTLMLLHMHQTLKPDQLVKFKAAYEKWTKEHHRG